MCITKYHGDIFLRYKCPTISADWPQRSGVSSAASVVQSTSWSHSLERGMQRPSQANSRRWHFAELPVASAHTDVWPNTNKLTKLSINSKPISDVRRQMLYFPSHTHACGECKLAVLFKPQNAEVCFLRKSRVNFLKIILWLCRNFKIDYLRNNTVKLSRSLALSATSHQLRTIIIHATAKDMFM